MNPLKEKVVVLIITSPPPSGNYQRIGKGRMWRPPDYTAWKEGVQLYLRAKFSDIPVFKEYARLWIFAETRMDIDNLEKPLFDALEGALYPRDARIVGATLEKGLFDDNKTKILIIAKGH